MRSTIRTVLTFATAAAVLLLPGVPASAAPGDADTGFGGGLGYAIRDLGGTDFAQAIGMDSAGNIIATDDASLGMDIGVQYLTPTGANLASIGGGTGQVVTSFGSANGDSAKGVAVDASDRVIIVGGAFLDGTTADVGVLRLDDGVLDGTFSGDGIALVDLGQSDEGTAVAIQPDGKIVIAATIFTSGNGRDIGVTRLLPGGGLDSTFSGDGKVIIDIDDNDEASGIALRPDGKILVGGSVTGAADRMVALRLSASGKLDKTFSKDGIALAKFGTLPAEAYGIVSAARNRVVLGGIVYDTTSDFGLVRFNEDGTLHTSFGAGGKVLINQGGDDEIFAIQRTGSSYTAAICVDDGGGYDSGVARFTKTGALDSTWGGDGIAIQDINPAGNDCSIAMAQASDGDIVTGGSGSTGDIAVARYQST